MKYFIITATVLSLSLLISFNFSCIGTSEVSINEENVFPTVTGTNLQGDEKTFPDCLEKDYTIVVVAFEQWQQRLVNEWYEPIEKLKNNNKNVAYFEIPTISKLNTFTRWFIYRGMRSGIENEEMRARIVTLHINKEPFKKALDIDTEETVFTYVLDKEGKILSRVKGEYEKEKWAELIKEAGVKK